MTVQALWYGRSCSLTLREIFSLKLFFVASKSVLSMLFDSAPSVRVAARRMPLAA